jgi:hypothetical protein
MRSLRLHRYQLGSSRKTAILASSVFVAATLVLGPVGGRSQQATAKVEQTKKIFCRFVDGKTNRSKTGVVSGLAACDDGDAEQLVAYTPCGEPQRLLPRKELKRSEVDCNGVRPADGDFAHVIFGKVIALEGDQLTIQYKTTDGFQTFKAPKDFMAAFKPQKNDNIVFAPTDPTKKTNPDALAKAFEKFKTDADRGVISSDRQGVVAVIVK